MDAHEYPLSPHKLPDIDNSSNTHYFSPVYQRIESYMSDPLAPSATGPMPIIQSRNLTPPPPLPPPRFITEHGPEYSHLDTNWQWDEARRRDRNWERSGSASISYMPGPSISGSSVQNGPGLNQDRPELDRRFSSSSTIRSASGTQAKLEAFPRLIDEGYGSLGGASIQSNKDDRDGRLGFQSSMHKMIQNNASNYDILLLKKLDTRRGSSDATPPPREKSRSALSSSLNESDGKTLNQDNNQTQPSPLPSVNTNTELPANYHTQWSDVATASSSRTSTPANQLRVDTKSSKDRTESLVFKPSRLSKSSVKPEDENSNGSRSSRGSYDRSFPDADSEYPVEETRRLQIDDRNQREHQFVMGQKRRASSPPREDILPPLHTVGSASDLFRRRESTSRSSPVPRIHSNHGSISSATSGLRNNSYTSTFSLAPSSISTLSSAHGRYSPGGISPGAFSTGLPSIGSLSSGGYPGSGLSPATSLKPGTLSPRTPEDAVESPFISPRNNLPHATYQRSVSFDARPANVSRKTSVDVSGYIAHQGGFFCECCPKKPRKFDTLEELAAHGSEKQYECNYCKNRFKNKNEMERHQNSLHLRHHSWSCAALNGYAAAFHVSQARPDDADTCGYCGEDFVRTGVVNTERNAITPSARDWELRTAHLIEVHKFGECNHAKKFYRADHFRQHLKHSHAGTSGKWTNVLENACMKDEPVPKTQEEHFY